MASNRIQAGAGTGQAVAAVVDATLNLGGLTLRAVEASSTLNDIHSQMLSKMDELHKVKGNVEDRFRVYWFPRKQLDPWLKMVEVTDCQARELTAKFSNLQDISGIHFPSRLDLIRLIETRCSEIDRVTTQGKELGDSLVKRETERVVKLATPINITNISTLREKLELILEYLKDENINTIRLHGAVGTGKRAIIEHLNNHKIISGNMFDIVLWLPASEYENHVKNSNIEAAIQHVICKRLGLGIRGDDDVDRVASKIRAQLEGEKVLLLLDNVKTDIKLDHIGIPGVTKGSKVVFTTNLPYVCPFAPFFNIKIARLSVVDSWQMFEEILISENDSIKQHDVGTIALKVVKWCDGLFSLIKIVAENFKSKRSPQSWSNGLQLLRRSAEKGDIYMQALENFLHFSYDGLQENQKLCFLFSALYPKDRKIPIDCLFDCWAAQNFLEYGSNMNDVGVTGQEILEHLLAMALLNESSDKKHVTMDKVFRAAAMKIVEKHHQYKCLVAAEALEKLQKNCCQEIDWISLANSGIANLPDKVECSKLSTLFLQRNSELKDFPLLFFEFMKELIVLDLYGTGIKSLPSMCNLLKLKVLYVNGCNVLKELPINKGFDCLEVLDIRDTIFNGIPLDIKNLRKLRRLLVSVIGGRVPNHFKISQLCALKELIIDVKSDNIVHVDEDSYTTWCNEVMKDVIEKIDSLKDLTTLQFQFKTDFIDIIQVIGDTLKVFVPKQSSLKHLLETRKDLDSNSLQVYIGVRMTPNLEIPKCFYGYDNFLICCDKIVNDHVIDEVLIKVKALILVKNNAIEHLDHVGISSNSIQHIQSCLVQNCSKIETLMQVRSFYNLKTLVLSKCMKLKVLFSNNVIHMGIEHLEIRDCLGIEEINMISTNGTVDVLPQLSTLVLCNLPMLTRIRSIMGWPSLKTLQIHGCCMLKELPLNGNSALNLRKIEVEKRWWEELQFSSDDIKQKFERYCFFSDMPIWP